MDTNEIINYYKSTYKCSDKELIYLLAGDIRNYRNQLFTKELKIDSLLAQCLKLASRLNKVVIKLNEVNKGKGLSEDEISNIPNFL